MSGTCVELIERATASHAVDYRVGGRAALGVLFLKLRGDGSSGTWKSCETCDGAAAALGGSAVLVVDSRVDRAIASTRGARSATAFG